MFCPNCGEENDGDYCTNCGEKLSSLKTEMQENLVPEQEKISENMEYETNFNQNEN